LHPVLQSLDHLQFPNLSDLNLLLKTRTAITLQSGKQLSFANQKPGKLAFEAQYEPRCYLSGEVQTRENNLHDLFNALVWVTLPKSKAAINARHYRALTETSPSLQTQRGNTRDMATLFDESGIIVACSKKQLINLLCNFQWKELFWIHREEVISSMGFYIFGHGLYEKAIQPYIGMTGQGLVVPVEEKFFNLPIAQRMKNLDESVATYLNDGMNCWNTRELTPVPLLGIPGWAEQNNLADYYDNQDYFRPGRSSTNNSSN
jgi:hypothetical protein